MNVVVSNFQDTVPVDERLVSLVVKVIELALTTEGSSAQVEVSVALVDDDYIQDLNRRFRGLDRPTDVLAFPMLEELPGVNGEPGVVLLGDVVLSIPTALRQAAEYGHDLEHELLRLAVHGTIHLLGYDHEHDAEAHRMQEREDTVLRLLEA